MKYAHLVGDVKSWAKRLIDDLNRNAGSVTDALRSVSTDTAVAGSDYFLAVDASAGPVAITLPALSLGRTAVIKKTDASANIVTVSGAVTIDGASAYVISVQYEAVTVIGGAAEWHVI